MVTSAQYTVTPLGKITNYDVLIGAQVQAKPFDDPAFKDETHVGIISEVKINKRGVFARFRTPALVGYKYIQLSQIDGYAHLPTPTPVAEPIAAQPAHMTDAGRYVGTLEHLNVKAGYGYVAFEGDTTRFETRHVFGGTQAVIALMSLPKGAPVTFAIRAGIGMAPAAIDIVVSGHEKSESHYTWAATRKAAAPAKPTARPRRNRDMNAQTVRQA